MTLLEGIKRIWKGQNPPIDIWHYLVGNYRYKLFYKNCKKGVVCFKPTKHTLMRQHIWEQICYRLQVMDKECFNKGQCKICQCETTQLQMSSKRCEGICYPTMMNKKEWERFKIAGTYFDIDGTWLRVKTLSQNNPTGVNTSKDIFYKETINGYVPINKENI